MQVLVFSFAIWFGMYMLAGSGSRSGLRLAGWGLGAYGLAIGLDWIGAHPDAPGWVMRWHWAAMFFPPTLWAGTNLSLIPEEVPVRARLRKVWQFILLPVTFLVALAILTTDALFSTKTNELLAGGLFWFGILNVLPFISAGFAIMYTWYDRQTRPIWGGLFAAALFFGLGGGLIVLPLGWFSRGTALLGISLDLVLLGIAVVWLDAFDLGETFQPELIRSLAAAGLVVLLFGGQVGLVIALGTGDVLVMRCLLLTTIFVALGVTVFADLLQNLTDRLVFSRVPALQSERADLRAAVGQLPRLNRAADPLQFDESAFSRLTRQALSHFSDLPRLTASPLTRLRMVNAYIQEHGLAGHSLDRAAALKQLLAESIERLKPPGESRFGTTDEWRFYNALYFPYVVGLRPYSRRFEREGLDPVALEALDWFQVNVPERTLYNWQTAAARLVARDLWEQQRH